MADKIANKILGGITAAGSLVASIFLSPPKYVWGISGLVVAASSLGLIIKNHWVESKPNEWLLVIRNGKLIKAGVGLKTFIGISDTVVRFPSKVEKVEFRANNVTK
jgi:regulator of protease activity HflC (stomatin/prohibitin superfamily)